jgi:hypothetical protein
MKITTKIGLLVCLLAFVVSSFAFKGQEDPKTLKFEFTLEEVNVIFEGLGELPAKKSEALRGKIYQTAQEQLKAQEQPQSLPKKN